MKSDDDLLFYDDEEAVKFISNKLPKELRKRIDEEMINYVLDVMYDFYDEKGLINEDSTEEASIDEEEMLNYIMKASVKDGVELSADEIILILDGEYEYGKSQGIYSEEE